MKLSKLKIENNSYFKLQDIKTDCTYEINSKEEAKVQLENNIKKMVELQDKLYAQGKYGILIIFQAMDTAGKDGAIKHVMSGLNPQGTKVFSFKQPTSEDLKHDYLRKASVHLPERGQIQIFNRSYYEEVLVVRLHKLLKNENIPDELITDDIWDKRYDEINNFEKYLFNNGIIPIKIFLHISKDEQKRRLLARIDDKSKNWKFSDADIKERQYWDEYQKYYEETISKTASKDAPWYVIPSDKKWFARLAVSEIVINTLDKLNLQYPSLSEEQLKNLEKCKEQLLNEI
ncbi:polyphosphate kinase 2 family protein [Clostridium hydrogenum]|uniref:polyphosphate kinase 2 family protein n=1 Tax=Clostridium hydrogenum TaxID=2855764 RepID=UPI001F3C81BD|nr:polyphosphate kinase 2 family protein [Clostridium hydrogenum]